MIEREGYYYLPILSAEMRATLETLPPDRSQWPEGFKAEYKRLSREFQKSKNEMRRWLRSDRDSELNRTAKAMIEYVLDCVNFETGRCDPSLETIADKLGMSKRTAERNASAMRKWMSVIRRNRTTSNFYTIKVSVQRVKNIEEYDLYLTEERKRRRDLRKQFPAQVEPTCLTVQGESEPTKMRAHEPTLMVAHEPTQLTDKYGKGTWEDEYENEVFGIEQEGVTGRVLSDDWNTPEELASIKPEVSGDSVALWDPYDSDDDVAFSRPRDASDTEQLMDDIAAHFADMGMTIGLRMRATMSSMHRAGLLSPASVRRMVEQTVKGVGNAAA